MKTNCRDIWVENYVDRKITLKKTYVNTKIFTYQLETNENDSQWISHNNDCQ